MNDKKDYLSVINAPFAATPIGISPEREPNGMCFGSEPSITSMTSDSSYMLKLNLNSEKDRMSARVDSTVYMTKVFNWVQTFYALLWILTGLFYCFMPVFPLIAAIILLIQGFF